VLSMLTINIGAAAMPRAESLLAWLCERPEDVLLLTETSGGPGTAYLVTMFRQAGLWVEHLPNATGDRGVAIVSKVPVVASHTAERLGTVSLPGRVALVHLATQPATAVLALYVPSRDRSLDKAERKRGFVSSLLADLDRLPPRMREHLIIGGDYNVISRDHQPRHPGFLPFEYGLLETLERHGFVDAHQAVAPGEQAHSWIGRTGDGYRYDYFHIGAGIAPRISGCNYLHETRELRLTDHAAVTLGLDVAVPERLSLRDPRHAGAATLSLF
jgi:exodeoxyribonuclease III